MLELLDLKLKKGWYNTMADNKDYNVKMLCLLMDLNIGIVDTSNSKINSIKKDCDLRIESVNKDTKDTLNELSKVYRNDILPLIESDKLDEESCKQLSEYIIHIANQFTNHRH